MSSSNLKTTIFQFSSHAPMGWSVFRVRTQSSDYHVGFGPFRGRVIAVLRGSSHGRPVQESDSAALVGKRRLVDVPPSSWVGECLSVGAIVTSPIASVEEERDAEVVRTITSVLDGAVVPPHRAVVTVPPQPEAQGAERLVLLAESAARRLSAIYEELDEDVAALSADEGLRARFSDAIAECAMRVRGIGRKCSEQGAPPER